MKIIKTIKNFFRNKLRQRVISITSSRFINYDKEILQKASDVHLTNPEKEEIYKLWGNKRISFEYHKLYKKYRGFDERYLPVDIYISKIIRSLNPERQSYVYLNKGLYNTLYPHLPQPYCLFKNIDDTFFDSNNNTISRDDAIKILFEFSKEFSFVIKPISESGMGKNVKKLSLINHENREIFIDQLINEYKSDFIVQEVVNQHNDLAKFNSSSLNTCRLTSLFLNGKTTIVSSIFRCGQNGALIDNGYAGGIMIGINEDGRLQDFGYDIHLNKYFQSSNGIDFKGSIMPNYKSIRELVLNNHKLIPTCHLIGWDIALSEKGEPIVIELNIRYPGITMEQLCTGPIFGERTEEVIEYVERNTANVTMSL